MLNSSLKKPLEKLGLTRIRDVLYHLPERFVVRRAVTDLDDAQSAYAFLRACSPASPFAQSFVTGNRYLIGGLFENGEMLQWFSQTTIEASWATGPSIRVRSVRDNALTELARKLFSEMRWTGLACAEFIRSTSGDYMFLEVNPRPWAAIQAAHYCGVPLLSQFADYLRNKRPKKQVEFRAGKAATLFPQFIGWRIANRRLGKLVDVPAYIQSIRAMPWRHPALIAHFMRRLRWGSQNARTREHIGVQ